MATNLTDEYIRRAIRLARVADGTAARVGKGLKNIHDKILKRITLQYSDLNAAKLRALNATIQNLLIDYYRDHQITITGLAEEVTSKEVAWNYAIMAEVTGQRLVQPILKEAARDALSKTYQGATFKTWFNKAGVSNANKITRLVQGAWSEGVGVDEAVRRVFGASTKAEADLRTLTRSLMMHTSVEARDRALSTYSEFIDHIDWNSILDNRTTPHICGIRDQLSYTPEHEPIDHDIPWLEGPGRIHFNCRSTSIPLLKGDKLLAERTSVDAGKNYKRGDNVTRTGRVRKPIKPNREKGILKITQHTNRTRYEGWLRSQPKPFVADVLGSLDKADKFKGGASLLNFLPENGIGSIGVINNISIGDL